MGFVGIILENYLHISDRYDKALNGDVGDSILTSRACRHGNNRE